ncbi:MAG TPA: hypothetical protein VM261_14760 [Kofleriaceae bacterium]|nr:hypothetical protein [Kofleriaceae bacterium]
MSASMLAACGGGDDSGDVTGPFTGTTHRFVVDRISVPLDAAMAMAIADDLDGNGARENHFGTITGLLASIDDLSVDGDSMIASGAIASTLELVADDLTDDATVGATFFGADGADATVAGGVLAGGVFTSNRTATTRAPGRAVLHVPAFTNSDPLALVVEGLELDLAPDGAGGYDAILRGGLRQQPARDAAYAGLRQMFATEPQRHRQFLRGVDTDRNGEMSAAELDASVIGFLVTADVQLFGADAVSLAISLHLAPCAEGRCLADEPANLCRDRVRDGDETDVDCGGSCQPCAGMLACAVPADCQSGDCAAGRCAPPSCTDGVHDGFESDRDCGGACPPCALGAACIDDLDCATGACVDDACAQP